MSKEMGPRERQLREQRERLYEENQKAIANARKVERSAAAKTKVAAELVERIATASLKTGKSRKKKK